MRHPRVAGRVGDDSISVALSTVGCGAQTGYPLPGGRYLAEFQTKSEPIGDNARHSHKSEEFEMVI